MKDAVDEFAPRDRGRFGDNERRAPVRARPPRVTGASDLHDFSLRLKVETPSAIGVLDDAGRCGAHAPALGFHAGAKGALAHAAGRASKRDALIWLPKSQVEFVHRDGGLVEVTMPEWLAVAKGLL